MENNEVVIVDIKMRFGSMVVFLIKLAFAAIPAAIVVAGICALLAAAFTAFFLPATIHK